MDTKKALTHCKKKFRTGRTWHKGVLDDCQAIQIQDHILIHKENNCKNRLTFFSVMNHWTKFNQCAGIICQVSDVAHGSVVFQLRNISQPCTTKIFSHQSKCVIKSYLLTKNTSCTKICRILLNYKIRLYTMDQLPVSLRFNYLLWMVVRANISFIKAFGHIARTISLCEFTQCIVG